MVRATVVRARGHVLPVGYEDVGSSKYLLTVWGCAHSHYFKFDHVRLQNDFDRKLKNHTLSLTSIYRNIDLRASRDV